MPSTNTPDTVIGEYPRSEAFAAARSLEHAGITTEVRGSDDVCRVLVSADQADRARRFV